MFSQNRIAVAASALAFFLSMANAPAMAQRLPNNAAPRHYSLQLTPNLQTATFTGRETIDLTLAQAADSIVLNAWQLRFDQVTAKAGDRTLPAEVSLNPALQQATFHFDRPLPAGDVTLTIAYNGTLNRELRGFYLSKTGTRNYAVTQFEPTDARRAFPSFDEPAWKATFDVSLVVDQGDTGISNTNIVSDTPGPGASQHTITFARTPRMSTYLVAFLVGDFQCISGESDGVPIRACTTPGKLPFAHFALTGAEFFLHYYDNYFGIKYPMPKLDMIAIPDFEAGAMENFGAITYRETAMLVDEKTASLDAKKVVAVDVAHEMAHQWFGDMVTMGWWNNVWLNEGFATWMSNKPLAVWKPEWQIPQSQAAELNDTLDLDAGRVTRAIRARAETPGEINEMFDGISYGKAAAVLQMTENYLGEESFRAGVHRYLQAHMYGNATAEDFWTTLHAASGKPADKIMESLVSQPGEPLLTFATPRNGKVEVSQNRFFLHPNATASDQMWTLPVCVKNAADHVDCQVLSASTQLLPAPPAQPFYGDGGGKGYYRSRYSSEAYQQILHVVETGLTPAERITFIGSQWAQARAGIATVGDFLHLSAAVRSDASPFVIKTVAGALKTIDQQVASNEQEHQQLASWVRTNFAPALSSLGAPNSSDAPDKILLRANLFELLGNVGADPQIIAEARIISDQYLQQPGAIDPTLAAEALIIAAQNGNAAFFDKLQSATEKSSEPQLRIQALQALAYFRDPTLVKRALDYAVSSKVKNQDAARLIEVEMRDRRTRDVAWLYVMQNWPQVDAQLTTWTGGTLVQSTEHFCSEDRIPTITAFFQDHPVPAAARALDKARGSITNCAEFRAAQEPNLKQWLRAPR